MFIIVGTKVLLWLNIGYAPNQKYEFVGEYLVWKNKQKIKNIPKAEIKNIF